MKTILTLGEFIENYGEGKIYDFEDAGGFVLCYNERNRYAFGGITITEEGRRQYAAALKLPCRIVAGSGTIALQVHSENDREASAIAEFVAAAAGYIPQSIYKACFKEANL